MTKVVIPYTPRGRQREVHDMEERWRIVVAHRRAGKTLFALMELQGKENGRGCLNIEEGRFAYIAPTYKQAKHIAWDLIKKFSYMIPGINYNESELTVTYPNGSKLRLFGADNPDSLRGVSFHGVVYDEYSQQPANIHSEIIRPTLSDTRGRAIWIGTPKGKNSFHDLWLSAQDKEGWGTKLLLASESGIIDEEELEEARKDMTLEEYMQEFECSFDIGVRGGYYSSELQDVRECQRIVNGLYDEELPVYTFWDIGVDDYTAIIFVQVQKDKYAIIDCFSSHGHGIDYYANIVKHRGYKYDIHYFPYDVKVREWGTGATRLELAIKLLGRCSVVPGVGLADGINKARLITRNTWFEKSKTQELLNSLASYRQEWDAKRGEFRDYPNHDWSSHFADGYRYYAIVASSIKSLMDNRQEMVVVDHDSLL